MKTKMMLIMMVAFSMSAYADDMISYGFDSKPEKCYLVTFYLDGGTEEHVTHAYTVDQAKEETEEAYPNSRVVKVKEISKKEFDKRVDAGDF